MGFNPTDPEHYRFYKQALLDKQAGITFKVPVDDPRPGFYVLDNKPVAIWYKEDGALACLVDGAVTRAMDIWNYAARNPISEFEYRNWKRERTNEPEGGLSTLGLLDDMVSEARGWLNSHPSVSNQADADKGQSYVKQLRALATKGQKEKVEEKAPHQDVIDQIEAKWADKINGAKEAVREILSILGEFLKAQEAKAKQIERDAGVEVAKPKVSGAGRGKATTLRKFKIAHVTDPEAAAKHYCNKPELLKLIQGWAIKEYEASGIVPPGVKIEIEERAV